jgi:diaminopimelate epimerase
MELQFYKYQGAGNDFILIDNRKLNFERSNTGLVAKLCDRRFGIGADGLMLLQSQAESDFEMIYYNADGFEGSLCGNGGRCIVAFASFLGIIGNRTKFMAVDGLHEAVLIRPDHVRLKMADISAVEQTNGHFVLNTGSPHYIEFTANLAEKNVFADGRQIRYNERFKKEGINVNFVEIEQENLFVRTYERGVENETFACGTGIVASAISAALKTGTDKNSYFVRAPGGMLKVNFERNKDAFTNVWLEGPAERVFSGKIDV